MDRNEKLDILKGLACILMIFAHNTAQVTGAAVRKAQFYGGMAPVFFFAVSGIILVDYQLKRKKPKELLLYYLIFFFLGFAYNDVWTVRDGSAFWNSNILQEIALSSIIIIIISLRLDVQKLAWFFPLPFFIHLVSPYLPVFPLKEFFFRPPGLFPVFPWLSFFLLGILCCRLDGLKAKFPFMVIPAGFMTAGVVWGSDYAVKWNMNPAYFTVSTLAFVVLFLLIGEFKKLPLKKHLSFFGKNSLLFLFVHLFARDIIAPYTDNNLILWAGSLTFSFFTMKILIQLNSLPNIPEKTWPAIWGGLLSLIFVIPLLPHRVGFVLAYATGFFISMNYSKLNLLVKSVVTDGKLETQSSSVNSR